MRLRLIQHERNNEPIFIDIDNINKLNNELKENLITTKVMRNKGSSKKWIPDFSLNFSVYRTIKINDLRNELIERIIKYNNNIKSIDSIASIFFSNDIVNRFKNKDQIHLICDDNKKLVDFEKYFFFTDDRSPINGTCINIFIKIQ